MIHESQDSVYVIDDFVDHDILGKEVFDSIDNWVNFIGYHKDFRLAQDRKTGEIYSMQARRSKNALVIPPEVDTLRIYETYCDLD